MTYNGKVYKAKGKDGKKVIQQPNLTPEDNSTPGTSHDEWSPETSGYKSSLSGTTNSSPTGVGTADKTNSRLSGAMSGAQSGINAGASKAGSSAATNAIAHMPGKGTTATIDSSLADQTKVFAGGHVERDRERRPDRVRDRRRRGGGAVGIGGSVLILNVESMTDAGISEYATI